jgi:hypothetical protein
MKKINFSVITVSWLLVLGLSGAANARVLVQQQTNDQTQVNQDNNRGQHDNRVNQNYNQGQNTRQGNQQNNYQKNTKIVYNENKNRNDYKSNNDRRENGRDNKKGIIVKEKSNNHQDWNKNGKNHQQQQPGIEVKINLPGGRY